MAKKKNTFGKFIALTTAAAAIGGTCYVFRDKIKQSSIYKATIDKASNAFNKLSEKHQDLEDDDFFFDDDDDLDDDNFDEVFSSDAQKGREYTSITINQKEETDNTTVKEEPLSADTDDTSKPAAEEAIPTISFGNTDDSKETADSTPDNTADKTEVNGYENENLSDTSEDPDVLEDQDKLDF